MQPSSTVMLFVQVPRVVPSRDEIQCLASVPTLLRDNRKEKGKTRVGIPNAALKCSAQKSLKIGEKSLNRGK